MHNAIVASGAILCYLDITQHTHISHITTLSRIEEERFVRLDKFTVRNLELIDSMCEDGRSLLSVIDRTNTPMGTSTTTAASMTSSTLSGDICSFRSASRMM